MTFVLRNKLSLLLLLVAQQIFSQTIQQIESDLAHVYSKLRNVRESKPILWDSVELYKEQFERKFLSYASKHPETFGHPFDSLRRLGVKIVCSEDKKFKIYSWDTYLGGTMYDFSNLFQYNNGDSIYSRMHIDSSVIKKIEHWFVL